MNKREELKQLIDEDHGFTVQPPTIDDNLAVLFVRTNQEFIDAQVRFMNHGAILDCPYQDLLPVLLREQA